jgi:hypothetical protein
MNEMIEQVSLAGSFTLPGTSLTLNRMGYGAMQLAGPGVWGPPRDVNEAIAVLREAVHSRENLQASMLQIPAEALADLNSIDEQGKEL